MYVGAFVMILFDDALCLFNLSNSIIRDCALCAECMVKFDG
jgi:hypothetical protein